MSTLVELPQMLLDHIEVILADWEGCTIDRYTRTGGEPAVPSGGCTAIWGWVDQIYDMGGSGPLSRRGDEEPCITRPAVILKIRVDVCYTETETDQTDAQHATTADCLHGLMVAIWCGLSEDLAAGDLLDQADCHGVTLGDFQVEQRQGGYVSASLSVSTELDCRLGDIVTPPEEEGAFDDGFDEGFS